MPILTDRALLREALEALDFVRMADLGEYWDVPDTIRKHLATPQDACADLDAIRAKAKTFFEWPDDRRDVVTLTSCIFFARQCIVDTAAENIRLRQAIEKTITDNLHLADGEVCTLIDLKRAVNWDDRPWQEQQYPWQPADTAPIDTPLLATYLDESGKPKIIRAELIGSFTQAGHSEWNCVDYDEATDCWYRSAGWVELMDHWDDADSCYINAQIIGWMPLPQPMEQPE